MNPIKCKACLGEINEMRMKIGARWVLRTGRMRLFHSSGSEYICWNYLCWEKPETCSCSWDVKGYSQPVELTASQRSRNIFYQEPLGCLLCPQACLHEIDWIRGNQEWRFSFYTSLSIFFSSHSVFSGRNDRLWCLNYDVY